MRSINERPVFGANGEHGISLIDMLVAVVLIGAALTFGLMATGKVTAKVEQRKLRNDVISLNAALQVYQANGGNLDDAATAQEALDALKTTTSGDVRKQIVGIRGAMTDRRLTFRETSGGSGLTAVWDPESKRFKIQNGGSGIQAFVLDDSLAEETIQTESRGTGVKYAKEGGWLWDYDDASTTGSSGVDGSLDGDFEIELSSVSSGSVNMRLSPPRFTHLGGNYSPSEFPLQVSIVNDNPPGSSVLYYSLNNSDWAQFTGTPVSVTPNQTLTAYAATVDTFSFSNSPQVSQTYGQNPIVVLSPPDILPSAPDFEAEATSFIVVTLENTNSPSVSELEYRLDNGAWTDYASPFTLLYVSHPGGVEIDARAVATVPDHIDSEEATTTLGVLPGPGNPTPNFVPPTFAGEGNPIGPPGMGDCRWLADIEPLATVR